jgi:hypothetical protein
VQQRTCRDCGQPFMHPRRPGRPPERCQGCRVADKPADAFRTYGWRRCECCGLGYDALSARSRFCRPACRVLGRSYETAAKTRRPLGASRPRCIVCGGPIISRLPLAEVCSKGCKIKRDKARRPVKDFRDPAGTSTCELCAESFSGAGVIFGRFCSDDCAKRNDNAKRYRGSTPKPRVTSFSCLACLRECVPGRDGVDPKAFKFCSFQCKREWHRDRRRVLPDVFSDGVSRADLYARDGWRCQLCGRGVKRDASTPHPLAPVLDHIIPLARGGPHDSTNVQLAHYRCNGIKGAGTFNPDGDQLRFVA